jgi:peptide-methionine (S)-S-oxide reductase
MRKETKLSVLVAAAFAVLVYSVFATQKYKEPRVTTDSPNEIAVAIFAGGCFWCMQPPFDKQEGVLRTLVGYTDGHVPNPSYKQVTTGLTGHTEAMLVEYDPQKVQYETLLDLFWRNVDPTVLNRQFCDIGTQYRTGIYWRNDSQKQAAEASKTKLEQGGKFDKIQVEIKQASDFYVAEDYHQDYYKKNPVRYKLYRNGCGRDARLEQLWGK